MDDTIPTEFTFHKETVITACKNGGCVLKQGTNARYDNRSADLFEKAFTDLDDLIEFFVARKREEFPEPPGFIPTPSQVGDLMAGRIVMIERGKGWAT